MNEKVMNNNSWWRWTKGLKKGTTIGEDEQEDHEEEQELLRMNKRIWKGTIVTKGSNYEEKNNKNIKKRNCYKRFELRKK